MNRRGWLAAAGIALGAALAVPLLAASAAHARAAQAPPPERATHVVVVGISGLTWNMVTKPATGELWRLAAAGSVGSLVDYAQEPLACPADGWLTLNSAARAQGPRPCSSLPAVTPAGPGARVPAMASIIGGNQRFHESPDWGLLGTLGGCATAVGPGAALALASPAGLVSSYVPSAGELSPAVLARCPLTVVDLGQVAHSERVRVSAIDRQLARITAELPPGSLLVVTAPGAAAAPGPGQAPAGPPHLMTVLVNGPGFAEGLLDSAATRRPGIVTLTDLTPTVAAWLGHPVPAGTVGARISRADRGSLASAVTGLIARDHAEQVWISTHGWFFVGYGGIVALSFGLPLLFPRGASRERRRRARCWRIAGAAAAAVPVASYLANLAPWGYWAHPAWWLYGMTIAWMLVMAAAALAGPWRRDALGPFGAICAATLLLLAVDVMAGSRLQLDAPFGLSLLVSGRFYGIGNDALGVYCVSALVAAAWLASLTAAWLARPAGPWPARLAAARLAAARLAGPWLARPTDGRVPLASPPAPDLNWPGGPQGQTRSSPGAHRDESIGPVAPRANTELAPGPTRPVQGNSPDRVAPRTETEVAAGNTGAIRGRSPGLAVGVVGVVGLLAVVASGWPGFGAKVGGTIALVPCLLLLGAWMAGARLSGRWAVPVAVSGLVVFLAFAVVSYFLPGAGVSDMGAFAGDLLHGQGGDLLQRKISSNVGSLTGNVFSWLIPVAAVLAAAALGRPAALRLRTLATAFAARPLLRVLAWLTWLVLVIGWFADDSGVIVPAAALAFAVPLTIAMAAAENL